MRAPILEYSPLLSDDDLLQIIASGIIDGVTAPIARRCEVSELAAIAIVATSDVSVVAALLANRKAQIREETLDTIIEQTEDSPQRHRPIVTRPELPLCAVRLVAGFVASSLLIILLERKDIDLDAETSDMLRKAIRERVNVEDTFGQPEEPPSTLNAHHAHDLGQLNDARISAAAMAHSSDYVIEGLALRSGIPERIVRRMIDARSGKVITALVWKGGLSMRTAL